MSDTPMTTPATAPVQGFTAGIPWSLHLRAWDAYAKLYGRQQSAERLAQRGGFHAGELDEFVPGWRDEVSEITRLTAALAKMEAERDAALSAVNGEPVPELVENFYGYEGVRARVLIGAIDGLSEASLATRCNARASEIMQLVKRAEAAEAANARLVEALTTLVDNVEEAARDSFATSAETFEKDFELEDADGYVAWKRAKDALAATPPAPAIAEAQRKVVEAAKAYRDARRPPIMSVTKDMVDLRFALDNALDRLSSLTPKETPDNG